MTRYWETIADNLGKAGWTWGCISAVDSEGRTVWIADAHRLTEGPPRCADQKSRSGVEQRARAGT